MLAHFEPGNRLEDFERGTVLDAAHPHYTLALENGERKLATHPEVLLMPFKHGPELHEREVGARLREERRKVEADGTLGSFGMLIDAQLMSIRRAKEAKEHAKVVKADDAVVPENLWDDRVKVPSHYRKPPPDISKSEALGRLRRLCHKLYLRRLRRDALNHLRDT